MSSMTGILLGQLKSHVQKVLRAAKNDGTIVIVECDFCLDFRKDAPQLLKKTVAYDDKGIRHEISLDI
jgi:hypothetical protein